MRTLTISFEPDLDVSMAQFSERAEKSLESGQYQGEYLNFATPALFFGRMTLHRWNIVSDLLGQGQIGLRELAHRLERDVKHVDEDVQVLLDLGLLEKTGHDALCCPYARIHIDMALASPTLAKAA